MTVLLGIDEKRGKSGMVAVRTLVCFLSLGVEGYVEGVGSADVEDALDCPCSSDPC